jgi:hypothetical protein
VKKITSENAPKSKIKLKRRITFSTFQAQMVCSIVFRLNVYVHVSSTECRAKS